MRWLWIALVLGAFCLPAARAGISLTYRDGVEEYDRANFTVAFATFKRLAEDGDARSQLALAQMYSLGEGVTQDYAAAARWFHAAANQGLAAAQFSLADLYHRGRGVARSDVDAYMWYSLSGELAGENSEQANLALAHRKEVARRMSAADRVEALRRACAWWNEYGSRPPGAALGGCGAD